MVSETGVVTLYFFSIHRTKYLQLEKVHLRLPFQPTFSYD